MCATMSRLRLCFLDSAHAQCVRMRVLVATDSFKDALPAREVCAAIARGLRKRYSGASIVEHPLADGGEGTLDVLRQHLELVSADAAILDPLFRPRRAQFALSKDGQVAYIELAAASGLQLLNAEERNPMRTSTVGTGQLIVAAIERRVRKIVLAIGGSATNDAGVGMLSALGWRFYAANQVPIQPIGGQLSQIVRIDAPDAKIALPAIDLLSDVDNPLYGARGAAHIYGRQKGASEGEIQTLDEGLRNIARCTEELMMNPPCSPGTRGAGAAGGVGFAAMNFLGATFHQGIEYVLDATRFDSAIEECDAVITGEGRIDTQTLHGKLIHGICRRAEKKNVPVVALCGQLTATEEEWRAIGLRGVVCINPGGETLAAQIARTAERLTATAAQLSLGSG
jgi:glycerate kinase